MASEGKSAGPGHPGDTPGPGHPGDTPGPGHPGDTPGPETRTTALLLSSLVVCNDAGLETFRDKRLSGVDVDLEAVRHVRDLARALVELMRDPEDPRWPHLETAWRSIVAGEPEERRVEPPPEPAPAVQPDPTKPKRKARSKPPPESEPAPAPGPGVRGVPAKPLPPPPALVPPQMRAPEPVQSTRPPLSLSGDALPFPSQPEALAGVTTGFPRMTVTVYAALCACCGAFPLRIAETHAKFGVADTRARSALDLAWREKFREDLRLQALWKSLFNQFRGWLAQHGAV